MSSILRLIDVEFKSFQVEDNRTVLEIHMPATRIPEPLIKSLEKMNLSPSQVEEVVGCAITHTQMNYLKDHRYTGDRS